MNMINKFASRQSKFNQIKQSRIPHLVNGWMGARKGTEEQRKYRLQFIRLLVRILCYICKYYQKKFRHMLWVFCSNVS